MIKEIQLYAERHTGSKWLTDMLKDSFGIENPWNLGWKHWFPDKTKIKGINQDEYLFIVLSRNPYDWLISMNRSPHHAVSDLKGLEMDEFLRKEWACVWGKYDIPWISDEMEQQEMMHERNPDNGERIKNVLELRNFKNREFLALKDNVKNVYYVRYEDLLSNSNRIINDISKKFDMEIIDKPKAKACDPGVKGLPRVTFNYINERLDWELESQLGYKKRFS
jgi:hypothetical protein